MLESIFDEASMLRMSFGLLNGKFKKRTFFFLLRAIDTSPWRINRNTFYVAFGKIKIKY